MKKLLIGLTLLSSMASFGSSCDISVSGLSADDQAVLSVVSNELAQKGYTITGDGKYSMDVFVYCYEGNETCASESKLIDTEKEFDSVQDLRNMHEPLFGEASEISALKTSLSMIPNCK